MWIMYTHILELLKLLLHIICENMISPTSINCFFPLRGYDMEGYTLEGQPVPLNPWCYPGYIPVLPSDMFQRHSGNCLVLNSV